MNKTQTEQYHQKLINWMVKNSVNAEHLVFENSCHSVQQAVETSGQPSDRFVKNICMINPLDDSLILAIVRGQDRASTSRIAKALQISRPRLATPEEILEKTGYLCGGTPSFGYSAKVVIDPLVLEKEEIVTGGGTEYALVLISTQNLLKAVGEHIVARARK